MKEDLIIKKEIQSPLGSMICFASNKGIIFLEFVDKKNYKEYDLIGEEINNNKDSKAYSFIKQLEIELAEYFDGKEKNLPFL